jgi:CRP-like cAMP-binding protein
VGELAVLDGQPRSASAVALDPLSTLVLAREDFLQLLADSRAITERVLALLAERVRYTTSYSEQLAFLSAPGRIARALLELAAVESDVRSRLELSQSELATFAGTTREWSNRALHDFADAGLIAIERRAITILDRIGLERRMV